MVVQLTREGNLRKRSRNESPTGLRQRTTCRLARQRCTKKRHRPPALVSARGPSSLIFGASDSRMEDTSSAAKRLGISPELNTLEMSSTKASSLICASEKRKTVGWPDSPACRSSDFRSSLHALAS
eukprot:2815180-Pleurochrysis_carterae.AAC.1